MASPQDIEKLKRNVDETWEEAFKSVDRTSDKFHDLVDEFVEFVGDWKEFSEIRRDRLADYVEGLDDVSTHWQDINKWIGENTDTTSRYVGSLTNIRDLFQSIAAEAGGIRRQTLDRVNITRNIVRLTNDTIVALKEEGGLTERINFRLQRRASSLVEQYNAQLKILGVQDPNNDVEIFQIRKRITAELERAEASLARLEQLRANGVRVDNLQLRYARERVDNLRISREFLDDNNRKALGGLESQIRKQKELFRIQMKGGVDAGPNATGSGLVELAARSMSKLGIADGGEQLKRDYGEWATVRVAAQQSTELARNRVEEQKQALQPLIEDKKRAKLDLNEFNSRNLTKISQKQAEQQAIDEQKAKLEGEVRWNKEAGRWISSKSGEFVSEKSVDKIFGKIDALSNRSLKLSKELKALTDEQTKLEKAYQSHSSAVSEATKNVESAQKVLKETEEEEVEVFSRKFPLIRNIGEAIKGMLTPAKLIGFAFTTLLPILLRVDDLASHLKQRIGSWETSLAAANMQFASAADWLQIATELTDNWHVNPITIFTGEEIGKMAEAKNLLGLTSEQAQALGIYAKLNNKSSDDFMKSMNKGFQTYNRTHRTAIAYGNVQREVLRTSDAIRLSYGGQGEALAKAANAALEMGMTMQQLENVAQNLTQFQSSIEAEMQAQLLTGKQLNLAKARELALNNDLAGVANEIKKQGIDAAWWGSANRIQQENMAKALGMSREEMAKMLVTQQLQNDASAKAIAANMKISEQEVKSMSASETWKKTIEKLAQAFAPIARILGVIADLISLVVQPIAGVIGWVVSLGGLFDRLTESTSAWANVLRTLIGTIMLPILGRGLGTFTNLFKTIASGFTGAVAGAGKLTASMGLLLTRTKKLGDGSLLKGMFKAPAAGLQKMKKGLVSSFQEGVKDVKTGAANKVKETKAFVGSKATKEAGKAAQSVKGTGENLGKLGSNIAKFLESFEKVTFGTLAKVAGLALTLAINGVPMAVGVGLMSLTGKISGGLVPLGENLLNFLVPFEAVTPATIGKLALFGLTVGVVGVPMALGVAALSGVGYISAGLPILGANLSAFSSSLAGLTPAVIGNLALFGLAALVAAPGILLLELASPLAFLLPVLGTALVTFASTLSAAAAPMLIGSGVLALFGLALIPVALALRIAAPAFSAFGEIIVAVGVAIKSAFEGIATVITAVFGGFANLLSVITLEKAVALAAVGGGFIALGGGLLLSTAGMLLFPLGRFERLSEALGNIGKTGNAMTPLKSLAAALSQLAESLDQVDLKKLEDIISQLTKATVVGAVSKFLGLDTNKEVKAQLAPAGETQKIPQENITEAAQEVTVKQAEAQANSQQISVEQKAADLSKIEKKMDELAKVIVGSRPDWNWLEFGTEMKRNTPWMG